MPQRAAGGAKLMTNGSPKILVVHDHRETNEDRREQEADAHVWKATFMLWVWPRT